MTRIGRERNGRDWWGADVDGNIVIMRTPMMTAHLNSLRIQPVLDPGVFRRTQLKMRFQAPMPATVQKIWTSIQVAQELSRTRRRRLIKNKFLEACAVTAQCLCPSRTQQQIHITKRAEV